jgi:hypothetical protein
MGFFAMGLCLQSNAQDDEVLGTEEEEETVEQTVRKPRPAKTFASIWLIDNQTVTVPLKGTFEMDIMHRFGPAKNGYEDFFGLFASSNIRLGFSYVPVEDLMLGFSLTRTGMTYEMYAKYAIIKQTPGVNWKYFSLTYYGNIAVESRKKQFYIHNSDRVSYFNQLILGRRFHERIAVQVAPSWTHVNVVDGYFSEPGVLSAARKHDHFAIALGGSIMLKENMNFMINYDQPLTKHKADNPSPNLSFGLEFVTSSHAFQIFAGHYQAMIPQRNNYYNKNDWKSYLIGFNITRLF